MASSYSHSLRVLACAGCGAPVEVDLGGGRYACGYCGAENLLAARDERADRERAEAPSSISEMERYGRLREQASLAGAPLPTSLEPLVGPDGRLLRERREQAKAMWLEARAQLSATSSFPQSEQLFHLTRLLSSVSGAQGRRAFLETAIELLPEEGHRHILRCMLSRFAVAEGELDAAEQWLGLCHTRPSDLRMDTAYRLAAATLAAARGDCDAVLSLLPEDMPLAELHEVDCALLRIHALERTGKGETAVRELELLREQARAGVLSSALKSAIPPDICRAVHRDMRRRDQQRRVQELEGRLLSPSPSRAKGSPRVVPFGCVLSAAFPSIGWCFAFMGTGEMGAGAPPDAWKPGPLSDQPVWVILSCLALALLGGPALYGLKAVYDARRARRELRGELLRARETLAELSAEEMEL